jgi:hypothetical protein
MYDNTTVSLIFFYKDFLVSDTCGFSIAGNSEQSRDCTHPLELCSRRSTLGETEEQADSPTKYSASISLDVQ